MKQKIRTASLLLLIVLGTGLVLMACGTKSLADSSTGGSDPYGLNVESMTGTDNCQMELQESEVLLSVPIYLWLRKQGVARFRLCNGSIIGAPMCDIALASHYGRLVFLRFCCINLRWCRNFHSKGA